MKREKGLFFAWYSRLKDIHPTLAVLSVIYLIATAVLMAGPFLFACFYPILISFNFVPETNNSSIFWYFCVYFPATAISAIFSSFIPHSKLVQNTSRAVFTLCLVACPSLFIGMLFNRQPDNAGTIIFLLSMLYFWFARLGIWVAFIRTPTLISFKIQDVVVVSAFGFALLSRWISANNFGEHLYSSIAFLGAALAFGLQLSKYTFELIELTVKPKQ